MRAGVASTRRLQAQNGEVSRSKNAESPLARATLLEGRARSPRLRKSTKSKSDCDGLQWIARGIGVDSSTRRWYMREERAG